MAGTSICGALRLKIRDALRPVRTTAWRTVLFPCDGIAFKLGGVHAQLHQRFLLSFFDTQVPLCAIDLGVGPIANRRDSFK
jgi:hypothetical protein